MAFTVGEAARLERSLLTEGSSDTGDADSLVERASAWFSRHKSGGRSASDSETFAFLCESLRFPRDATVRALAAGALRILERDGSSHPHRAGFAARFAAKRIRAICGVAPLWSAIPLSSSEQADAQALFEAAQGDRSYSDEELIEVVTIFVTRYRDESTMFGRLATDLLRLVGIIRDSNAETSAQSVARAALTYFAVAEDAIPDDRGFLGLLDDVYVVQRAIAEISPERGAIVSLLDDLVRREPFVRDIVFDVDDVTHPLSEFSLINAGLLLARESTSGGVALIVPSTGVLPIVVGFIHALGEVHRFVDSDGWPKFTKGELLINPESGAGVLFESYGRLADMAFGVCAPAEATHICFLARPAGRDKSPSAYTVKCFRPVEDVLSFRRAHTTLRASGGAAVFDRDRVRLGVLERLFGTSRPVVIPPDRKQVIVVGPLGEARQTLEELSVFRSPAIDVFPIGQAKISETGVEYRTWTKSHDGCGPILTFVRSTADASVLCDDPGTRVAAVIAPVRSDSSDAVNLTRISGNGVRVLAMVEQRHAEAIEHLEKSAFDCWVWDSPWLNTVYWQSTQSAANPILKHERQLREQANAKIVASHLSLPGLSNAYTALRKAQAISASVDNELLRLFLGEGFGLLLHLCRLPVPVNGLSSALAGRLKAVKASMDRGLAWWSDEMVELVKPIPDEFDRGIVALATRNPKFDALTQWVTGNPDGQIVCNRFFREALRKHLDCARVHLVERVDRTGAPALVPAWLQKERMSRLLFPPASADLTLLLYDPEVDWHGAAVRRHHQALEQARSFAAERPTFPSVRRTRPMKRVPDRESSFDPFDVVTEVRRARALKYLRSVGGDTVPAHLVQFVGGHWAAFSELHRVHTVTHLVGSEKRGDEEIRETVASELRSGDYVLLVRGTDRDALREEVDTIAPAGTRNAASAWQRALQRYAVGRSIQELVGKLAKAGCQRIPATVERWLRDESMIGPRGAEDVHAILSVTEDQELKTEMTSCLDAISQLRGLHVKMAHTIAARVFERARQWLEAGAVPDELIEVEDRLVLAVVESVDGALVEVPRTIVNRLQEDK